jgi:hypothetical protein
MGVLIEFVAQAIMEWDYLAAPTPLQALGGTADGQQEPVAALQGTSRG